MSWISEGIITNPKVLVRDAERRPRTHFPCSISEEEMTRFRSRFPYELLQKLQGADSGKGSA